MRNSPLIDRLWRKDFSDLPANRRRAARYALQMLAGHPLVRRRLAEEPFLGALWTLALPLVEPHVLLKLKTIWHRPDPDPDPDLETDDVDESFGDTWRRHPYNNENPLPDGVPGARMRADLARVFAALPDALFARLAVADGEVPTSITVAVLAGSAGLDAIETALLDYLEKKHSIPAFRTLLREAGCDHASEHFACVSAALGVPVHELKLRLRQTGNLRILQLVSRRNNCDLEDFLNSQDLLHEILDLEPGSTRELLHLVVQAPPAPQCALADFPHLAKDIQRVRSALHGALAEGTAGINALFYGPPGTGKTQLALALAHALDLSPIMVKTADGDGDGLSRQGRLGAYQLVQRLLRGRRDCIVIFDEVEDAFGGAQNALLALFGGDPQAAGEKGWMNRTLEDNPIPAIWITNDAASMDRAFLRRFLLPVSFTTPPQEVRRQIAERYLGDLAVPDMLIDELAADSALLPAHFSAARRLLDLQHDALPETVIREGVSASRRLLEGSPLPRARKPATQFDAAYLNLAGGIAPGRIADALARTGRGSLCFYGPPGTGKTEFAQVLADALGRELISRSTSDLVSPYVGQTEQNLARLFAEIDVDRTVLFLDEIDSLLRDRRQARHSWETTQVNELLQQMERFPGIFIAATNLIDRLDAAAMRRFDFKLQFRPLNAAQRLALYAREALGSETATAAIPASIAHKLSGLEVLTPGDFANVVRQRDLLGESLSPEDFLRRLLVECRWKQQAERAEQ